MAVQAGDAGVFLTLASSLVGSVLDILNVFRSIPFVGTAVSVVFNGITGLVSLIILVFCIIAITKVVKEQDAGLPLVSKLANRAFGLLEQKVYTQAGARPARAACRPGAAPLSPAARVHGTQAPGQNNGQQPPQQ